MLEEESGRINFTSVFFFHYLDIVFMIFVFGQKKKTIKKKNEKHTKKRKYLNPFNNFYT